MDELGLDSHFEECSNLDANNEEDPNQNKLLHHDIPFIIIL